MATPESNGHGLETLPKQDVILVPAAPQHSVSTPSQGRYVNTQDGLMSFGQASVAHLYSPKYQQEVFQLAASFVQSGLYKVTVDVAFVLLSTGRELGIPPTYAMTQLVIVSGKVVMQGALMVALVRRDGHRLDVLANDTREAHVRLTRKDGGVFETVFSLEDAKRAGLLGKDNWSKFPRQMMLWRAVSEVCRIGAPECLGGIGYTPEDFNSVVIDGQLIPDLPALGDGAGKPGNAGNGKGKSQEAPTPAPGFPTIEAEWTALLDDVLDILKNHFGYDEASLTAEQAKWGARAGKDGYAKALACPGGLRIFQAKLADKLADKLAKEKAEVKPEPEPQPEAEPEAPALDPEQIGLKVAENWLAIKRILGARGFASKQQELLREWTGAFDANEPSLPVIVLACQEAWLASHNQ
jgi:hypothetical protein